MSSAYEPFELTANFVVGLDDVALEAARLDLATVITRFEASFERTNGRKPKRQEMTPVAEEVRALLVISNEKKRRDRLGDAARQRVHGAPTGSGTAGLGVATDGAQNAALTQSILASQQEAQAAGASQSASAGPRAGGVAAGMASTRAPGGMASFLPGSATVELVVTWLQYLSLTNVLIIDGVEIFKLRGIDVDAAWVRQWQEYMAWTALFNLDFAYLADTYPDLELLGDLSWNVRHLTLTVLLPLVLSFTTVLLIKDLPSVMWILVLTASLMATVFTVAAKALLSEQRSNPQFAIWLELTDYVLYLSVAGLVLCIASYALKKVLLLREENRALLDEVERVRFGGSAQVGGAGYGVISPGSSPPQSARTSRSNSPANSLPPSPGRSRVGRESYLRASLNLRAARESLGLGASGAGAREARDSLVRLSQTDGPSRSPRRSTREGATPRELGIGAIRLPKGSVDEEEQVVKEIELAIETDAAEPPSTITMLRNGLLLSVAGVVGLVATLRLVLPSLFARVPLSESVAWGFLGGALLVIAVLGSSVALAMCRAGRIWVQRLTHGFRSYYIGFLLIVLQMLYIPVTRSLMSVYKCNRITCGAGSWYPVASPTLASLSFSVSQDLSAIRAVEGTCEACPFFPRSGAPIYTADDFAAVYDGRRSWALGSQSCPLAAELCPGTTTLRLAESPDLECEQLVLPFYGLASALMLVCFSLGTPFLYGHLIREHTWRYFQLPADPAADVDDQWAWRVQLSKSNKASNLYADFEYRFRYYKLAVLVQKCLLIVTLIFCAELPLFAAGIFVVIHAIFLAISSFLRPYLDPRPDMLAIAVSFVSTFNPAMALLAFLGVPAPDWTGLAILAINLGVPICFVAVGVYLRHMQRGKKAEAAARRAEALERERRSLAELGEDVDEDEWDPDSPFLRLQRQQIERAINEYTLRFLVNFFAIVVVFCFLAGSVVLLGFFNRNLQAPVIGHTTPASLPLNVEDCVVEDSVRQLEFLTYGNWEDFTRHCCCMPRPVSDGEIPLTELWACDNGLFKERQRRGLKATSIQSVRGFCSVAFVGGQVPVYYEDQQRFGIEVGEEEVVFDFW